MRTVHESDKCVAIHVYSTVLSRKHGNSTAGVFCGGERREGKKKAFSRAAPQRSTSHTAAALYVRECEEKRICKSIPANSVVVTYRRR